MTKDGFPTNDEHSILAGCCGDFACDCTVNLDIYYPHQFVQNEETANTKSGNICKYQLERGNLVKNATGATIYYDDVAIYTFCDYFPDGLKFQKLTLTRQYPDRVFPEIIDGSINCSTGLITLTWDKHIPVGKSHLIVSYEYNMECQMPPQVECPNCKHKFCNVPKNDAITLQELANGDVNLDIY